MMVQQVLKLNTIQVQQAQQSRRRRGERMMILV